MVPLKVNVLGQTSLGCRWTENLVLTHIVDTHARCTFKHVDQVLQRASDPDYCYPVEK